METTRRSLGGGGEEVGYDVIAESPLPFCRKYQSDLKRLAANESLAGYHVAVREEGSRRSSSIYKSQVCLPPASLPPPSQGFQQDLSISFGAAYPLKANRRMTRLKY